MTITTHPSSADASAAQWQEWRLRYAESSRKSATQARIVFTVLFVAVAVWLALELLA
jgi:hypothetical protein